MTTTSHPIPSMELGRVVDRADANATGAADLESIRDLIHDHGVVVLRSDRTIEPGTVDQIARTLGQPAPPYRTSPRSMPGFEYLDVIDTPATPATPEPLSVFPNELHHDSAGRVIAPYSVLNIVTTAPTPAMVFVDLAAVLDELPGDLRNQIDGRYARHARLPAANQPMSAALPFDETTATELPLVVHHPRDGRSLLHLPRHPDSRITGLGVDEGRELLAKLWAIVDRSAARFEHSAAPGDLVIWDNIGLLHTNPSAPRTEDRSVWFATLGEPVALEAA